MPTHLRTNAPVDIIECAQRNNCTFGVMTRNTSFARKTAFRTDFNKWMAQLWLYIVVFCAVITGPRAAEGLVVRVPGSVNATGGEPTTIPCTYTDDKQDALLPSARNVLWRRTFANGSVENLVSKTTGQVAVGKWYDEKRAKVVEQASLNIFKVSGKDAGKYSCVVGEAHGTTELFVDETPKIQTKSYELVLNVHQTLELTCIGADQLSWVWPFHGEQSITLVNVPSQQRSVLQIERVSTPDTGEYRCVRSIAGYNWKSEPVYVFITSEEESLFLETNQTDLTHYWDESSIIPCRVTNPNASVTLLPIDQFASDDSTTFDPRIGFFVAAELSDYSGNVACRAVLGNKTDIQNFTVNFVGKPDLSVKSPEITISENTTLELICSGVEALKWYTPSDLGDRVIITHTLRYSPSQLAKYKSVLRLSSTVWKDTAEYSCVYERYANSDQPQLKSSVYVFVKSAVPDNVFLPQLQEDILLKTGRESFTVPCRVSNPNITDLVRLIPFYAETSQSYTGFGDHWDWTYDPKVGFQVSQKPAASPIRKLTMTCSAQGRTVAFIVRREGESGTDFFTREIVPSANRLVQGNEPFSVTCKIIIPIIAYSKWTQVYRPQIEFTYPHPQETNATESTVHNGIKRIDNAYKYAVERKLTIGKVSLHNQGIYTCQIFNIELNLTLNTSLTVLERGFIKLTHYPPNQSIVEGVKGQEDVCLQVLMESFPDATFHWSKDGTNQTNETAPRFSVHGQLQDGDQVIISGCIQNLTALDGGVYSLTAVNENQIEILTVQLVVLELPEVNLTVTPQPSYQDPPLYYTMQQHSLVCHAWGNPLPQISWQWHRCTELCTELQDGWSSIDSKRWASVLNKPVITPSSLTRSVLTVYTPPSSGVFRCLAVSPSEKIHQTAFADIKYRLIDFNFSLPAAQEVKTVYTYDQTSLRCQTSIYAFENAVVWDWTPSGNSSQRIQISADHQRVGKMVKDGYHYTSVLTIHGALVNDTGVFRCLANKTSTGESVVVYEVQLNVKDIIPPVVTKMVPTKYALDKTELAPNDFKLECQATGDPVPSLVWYKDGSRITTPNELIESMVTSNNSNTVISELFLASEITPDHGGTYTCNATNKGGSDYSESIILIEESPTAVIEKEVYNEHVGNNLTITCETTGKPTPVVKWQKEQKEIGEMVDVPQDMYADQGRVLSFKNLKKTDEGVYFCIAENDHGVKRERVTLVIQIYNSFLVPVLTGSIIASVIVLTLLVCVVALAKKLVTARKAKRNLENIEMGPVYPRSPRVPMSPFRMSFKEEFGDQLPFDSKWEFPRDRLKLGAVIGQGAFGMVLKGVAAGINMNDRYVPVAVKTVKSDASYVDRKALFGELKMLIHVGHHLNVVNFLGACTQDSPPLVIVEFCPYGNLCDFLRSKRDSFNSVKSLKSEQEENNENELNYADLLLREACVSEPLAAEYELVDKEAKRMAEKNLTVEDLVCFCFQVARGMEFLASRKCIHRDMAARNVLLGENSVVKICDFGLSRSFYHDSDYIGSGKGLLPIKWMAPEAIFDKVFTTYSDIWSFGIFTWEVFSLGGSPYPGIQVDERFYDKMKSGYRMSCPEHAPRAVYQLMLECWSDEPKDRPMFSELAQHFGELLESNTRQEYIDLNIPYQEGQYCELDFGKTSAKQIPDTVIEETEAMQLSSDDHESDAVHFSDPAYHKGLGSDESASPGKTLPTQSFQPQPQGDEGCSSTQDTANQESEGSTATNVQLQETLPDDPYRRESDDQLHTYTSLKGARPGLSNEKTVNDYTTDNLSSLDDGDKLHTYASIKVPRPDRTEDELSLTDPDQGLDRSHLYSSIKGSRPNTIADTTPEVKCEDVDHSDSTEGTKLLGKPKLPDRDANSLSLGQLPDGHFRVQKSPLPRRDFSTTSWSPERETLLSSPESPNTDTKLRPVFV